MKKKKILSMLLATVMAAGSLAGCGSSGDTPSTSTDTSAGSKTENTTGTEAASTEAAVRKRIFDYQYGLDTTFHSDDPVTYSFFSRCKLVSYGRYLENRRCIQRKLKNLPM